MLASESNIWKVSLKKKTQFFFKRKEKVIIKASCQVTMSSWNIIKLVFALQAFYR